MNKSVYRICFFTSNNISMGAFKSSENIQMKEGGQTDLFLIMNSLQ